VARGWGSIARDATRTARIVASFGLIAYLGMHTIIKIETTRTRLFLVAAVFGVAFGVAYLSDHLLRNRVSTDTKPNRERAEIWLRWYSQFSARARWGNIAAEAARSVGFWLFTGLITYLGINAVIKIEATSTRVFLVVVVFGVAFGAASLLERQLRHAEPADEDWPHWYSPFNNPTLYRSCDDAPYGYVVLPRPMLPDWPSKRGTRDGQDAH
jgi:hypothetical protein